MATQVTNYQCPACTGPMHFDGTTGRLVCDYCDSTYTVEEIEALYLQKNEKAEAAFEKEHGAAEKQDTKQNPEEWDESFLSDDWGREADGLRTYSCPSCGAELLCNAETAATSCPYCGNSSIIPGQFSGALKPDYVIPFKIKKEQAIEELRRHYAGKKLLPKLFSEENHIQEIKGIYVPFWLFDGKVNAGVSYTAEIVMTHTNGKERVIETSYFDVERAGTVEFAKIPTDASRKLDDALMDSLEPYDYRELKPFSAAYLPGFLADRYDVSVKECAQRADARALKTAEDAMRESVRGYVAVVQREKHMQLCRGKVQYALLPVWLLNTRWKDKQYTFAMNGQTGKFIGDLPMDKRRYWKWRLIYGGVIGLVTFAVMQACTLFL